MTTREFHIAGADFFDDEAFDLGLALEAHLVDPTALTGDEATWIDAPVAMIVEDTELEVVDLDAFDIPIDVEDPAESAQAECDAGDAFAAWLRALVGAAQSVNMLVSHSALRSFLNDGHAPRQAFPHDATDTLAEANIARLEGDTLVATAAFLRVVAEWRSILAGEGGDFSRCGSNFDDWSADFLARSLGAPAKFDWLKRELRRRGIAAFGLVEAA
ncbi:MAG TPA: hypothetical protein VNO21_16725 [Polyangiaceae bacterium]|nr:hypothetical protein [Polyangiaceae bacterium]